MKDELKITVCILFIVVLMWVIFIAGIRLGRKIERRSTENNTKTYAYCLEEEDAGSRN